nr:putative capsid protein [Crucivirus sp.]
MRRNYYPSHYSYARTPYQAYNGYRRYSYGSAAPSTATIQRVASQAAAKGAAMAIAKAIPKSKSKGSVTAVKAKPKKHANKVVHNPHKSYAHRPTHASSGVGRSIGEMVGGMIPVAGPIAEKALGWLGDKLEDGIGSLFGFGEYKVENNSLMDGGGNVIPEGGRPPMVSNAFKHDGSAVVVRHQEPLGDIITSSNAGEFKLQNFFIQPGLATSFPWLASMAQNFQQYRILGMLFEFRSMAADAISGTNIALGTVTMATNYNSSSPNYISKKDMQNSEYATSTKPSLSVFHPIECSPEVSAEEVLYIRNAGVPDGDDQRLYDWGNFQIATSGFQGTNVTIGELWVTYEVALIKPKAVSTIGSYILAAHMQGNSSAGLTAATPFLGNSLLAGSTLNLYVTGGGTTLNFDTASGIQVGQKFKVDFYFAGVGGVSLTSPTVTFNGFNTLNRFNNTTGTRALCPPVGVSSSQTCLSYLLEVTSIAVDPSIVYNAGTVPTALTTSDVYVVQVPVGL